MDLVIGLCGRIGSGKGTIAQYLKQKHGAEQFVYSKILSDILDRLHIESSRENLQTLGAGLRETLGAGVLVEAMKGDVSKSKARIKLIDGIRYVNEVDMLRSFPNNILIFVDAPFETRLERIRKRAQKGEATISEPDFRKRERAATEIELDDIKKMADYIVDNTGTIADLHKRIEQIIL